LLYSSYLQNKKEMVLWKLKVSCLLKI
jgi:hypothetical protein